MGTKVQSKSYLPRYYPMRDLNEEASSNWSPFYDDTTFSRQLFNDIKPGLINGYSEYDKEMLKRTMLEHEAIFRKQVYELHRLYRIQKDLMDEFKTKRFYRLCRPTETSKLSNFSSQVPSEAGEKVWHVSHPALFSNQCNAANVADADGKRGTINFLKEASMQYNLASADNGGHTKNCQLTDTELKKSRRTIDLHLPADVYIKSEDTRVTERKSFNPFVRDVNPNMIASVHHENDVKWTLGTEKVPSCRQDDLKPGLHTRSGDSGLPFRGFADLNEPVEDPCDEGAAGSGSFISNALEIQSDSIQVNRTKKSNFSFLPKDKDFLMDRGREERTFLNHLSADKGETKREWPLPHDDSGQGRSITGSLSSDLFTSEYPMSSELIQLRLKKPQDSHLSDMNKSDPRFGERTSEPTEICGRGPHLFYSKYPATQATNPFSVASPSACPTIVSGRKPTKSICHLPVAVQALPCFSGSALSNGQSKSQNGVVQNQNFGCDKLHWNGDLLQHLRTGSKSTFSASCHMDSTSSKLMTVDNRNLNKNADILTNENFESSGLHKCVKGLMCTDIKSVKDLNLSPAVINKDEYSFTARKDLTQRQDDSKGVLWLKEAPCNGNANMKVCDTRIDFEYAKDHYQLISSFNKVDHDFPTGEQRDRSFLLCDLQNSLSSLKVESRIQSNGTSDILNNEGIVSFPSLKNIQQSFNCSTSVSFQEQSLADYQNYSQKGKSIKGSSSGIGSEINLNSPVEDEEFSLSYLPNNASNLTCKIDIEAPVSELEENNRCSPGEPKLNYPEKPIHMSKEDVYSDDSVRAAGGTIISISMASHNSLGSCISNLLPPVSCDSLRWFAEVVASNCETIEDSSGTGHGGSQASDNKELDLFEYMTLKLEEVKEDEFWTRPYQHEEPKDETKCTASLLFMRPRRGQARKRRQKRDFQKDILPTLASLSRQEVTEDLQALGGITKTSSRPRAAASTKRSTVRNGLKCAARGRRPRSLAITVSEVHLDRPPLQPTPNELAIDGSIKGWGRTTRRCRRQRMPSLVITPPQS